MWSQGITGSGIKVAVMDSGVDYNHPDLLGMKKGYNAIEPSEPIQDETGHGTLVAGVIVAKNNNIGVVGIAPDVELYPVKVLDKFNEGNIDDIVKGIDWCITNDIDIINMSFAINLNKPQLKKAIDKAINEGIIVVAAANNSSKGPVGYPASYPNVFSVTSVNEKFQISELAPIGKIDYSAPGVSIISTSLNGSYQYYSGNSVAAPHITGFIALTLQTFKKAGIPQKDIKKELDKALKKYSFDLGNVGRDNIYGEGFIRFIKSY
ncbi:S8 family peptidase [Paenibacillus sp. SC116]|uniref:S8 family peptidase n=1 Tax=Paenibacillus sp. SC116 TaxID=2968986 RepID=UPI00215AD8C8|nr:S8 family peptidase [Paenibacillus sp. SC116]MCR8843996.1 S8 family peptidase [Paenibacillus sp. SC116]